MDWRRLAGHHTLTSQCDPTRYTLLYHKGGLLFWRRSFTVWVCWILFHVKTRFIFFSLCWLLQLAWHSEIAYLHLHLHSPSHPILYEDYCVCTCGKRILGGGVICVLKSFWIRSLGWKIPYFSLLLSLLFSLEHTLYYSISHSVVHSGLVWHHTCAGRKLDWARWYLTLELCWRSSTSDQSD